MIPTADALRAPAYPRYVGERIRVNAGSPIVIGMDVARRRIARTLVWDGLLAAALGAFLVVGSHGAATNAPAARPLDLLAYALIGVAAASLLVRRLWPPVTLAATVGATAAYLAIGYTYGPVFLVTSVGGYSVAARWPAWRSLGACVLALVAVYGGALLRPVEGAGEASLVALLPAGFLLVPWAVGTAVRLVREDAVRAREEEARRLAYDERMRVAREVHDVVGHGLAAINMQAGIALHVLERRPEQAKESLEAIRQSSKEALDELRGTLAVFRQPDGGDGTAGDRRPATGLDQLDALVARMGEAGLPVDLAIGGDRTSVPAAVDLAAYRVVQESLTNVARHAGPATAAVRVHYAPDAVGLEIADDGKAQQADGAAPGGHGIAGMRERAAALGGTLEAGPRPEGGFRVRAHLPYGEAHP